MTSVWDATISGFNEYILSLQNDTKADFNFSLTLFDTNVDNRFSNVPVNQVQKLNRVTYTPSGMTALYDAVCSTINQAKGKVGKKDKSLVVIMTDGEENSSHEYTQTQLATMIKDLQAQGNWSFVFLGANQDAWAKAGELNIAMGNAATFTASSSGTRAAFAMMASNTSNFASSDTVGSKFFSADDQDKLKNTK